TALRRPAQAGVRRAGPRAGCLHPAAGRTVRRRRQAQRGNDVRSAARARRGGLHRARLQPCPARPAPARRFRDPAAPPRPVPRRRRRRARPADAGPCVRPRPHGPRGGTPMSPVDLLLEPLQYEFMVRALAATVAAAIVCALLSCWLVLVGWSLMGDAVSHAVLPGVVLSYIVGVPFAVGAIVFGMLAVALIGTVRGTSRVKEDAAIGIVFTTLFALGL